MKFDAAIFAAYMRIFCGWLPFWLMHSWTTMLINCFDSEVSWSESLMTPALAHEWYAFTPISLLGLVLKYLIGLPLVVLAFSWLCMATTFKMCIWIVLIMPVMLIAFLSATRRPLEEGVTGLQTS